MGQKQNTATYLKRGPSHIAVLTVEPKPEKDTPEHNSHKINASQQLIYLHASPRCADAVRTEEINLLLSSTPSPPLCRLNLDLRTRLQSHNRTALSSSKIIFSFADRVFDWSQSTKEQGNLFVSVCF